MDVEDPLPYALGDALRAAAKKLVKRAERARQGDPEGVHDTRTMLRRVRIALGVVAAAGSGMGTWSGRDERTARRLRDLEKRLSGPRDADVLLADLRAFADRDATTAGELAALVDALERDRRRSRRRAAKALRREEPGLALKRLADRLRWSDDPAGASGPRATPSRVRHVAAEAIWRAYGRVFAFDVRDLDEDGLHALRAACRRLRYTLELLRPSLGAMDAVVLRLRELQDGLGRVHDCTVALARVEQAIDDHELDRTPAIASFLAHARAEKDRIEAEQAPRWRYLFTREFRAELAAVLEADAPWGTSGG